MKPLPEPRGDRNVLPRQLLVFSEDEFVLLSIVCRTGTLTFPMSRKGAGNLVSQLGKVLAQLPGR
jgi:hypothetical protein